MKSVDTNSETEAYYIYIYILYTHTLYVVSPAGQGDFGGGQIGDGTEHLGFESVSFSFRGGGVSRSLSIATWNCACLFGGLP